MGDIGLAAAIGIKFDDFIWCGKSKRYYDLGAYTLKIYYLRDRTIRIDIRTKRTPESVIKAPSTTLENQDGRPQP